MTIKANPVSGYINYTTKAITNVVLTNNSKFSIVYTNPVANNYNLITITSTGVNNDDSSTKVISQQVQLGSILVNPTNYSLSSKGNVTMSGNATITNTSYTNTIQSAGNVTLSGNASTVISSGNFLRPGNLQSDVQANNGGLAGKSQSDFYITFFWQCLYSTIRSKMQYYYQNSSSTSYNSILNGKTGTSIWIDQTGGIATLSGNTTVGSASAPVLCWMLTAV